MTETIQARGWTWFAGDNDEMYHTGPCDSREDAIAAAIREGTGQEYGAEPAQYTIYLIEARQDPIELSDWIDVGAMVENLHERLGDDLGGEDGESPAEGAWTDEQHTDLEAAIKAAVTAWQARHSIAVKPRQFTDSRNAERITIPEAVAPSPDEAPIAQIEVTGGRHPAEPEEPGPIFRRVTLAPSAQPVPGARRLITDEVDEWPEGWRPGDPPTVSLK